MIDSTEVEEFFELLNPAMREAKICYDNSISNIDKVLNKGKAFTEKYLKVESSFYEIIASIGAIGKSLDDENVVKMLGKIVESKMELCEKPGAWPQYSQFASWLTYLGTLVDVQGSSIETTYLKAVQYSMEHMSERQTLGYSWHAYQIWKNRWPSMSAANRKLVTSFISKNSEDKDALRIISLG